MFGMEKKLGDKLSQKLEERAAYLEGLPQATATDMEIRVVFKTTIFCLRTMAQVIKEVVDE